MNGYIIGAVLTVAGWLIGFASSLLLQHLNNKANERKELEALLIDFEHACIQEETLSRTIDFVGFKIILSSVSNALSRTRIYISLFSITKVKFTIDILKTYDKLKADVSKLVYDSMNGPLEIPMTEKLTTIQEEFIYLRSCITSGVTIHLSKKHVK
jgi:hypothetical protein